MANDDIDELRAIVDRTAANLLALSPETAARKPASGGWSVKEVVGHLIDSAANNHQRFVRGQLQQDAVFNQYAQDDWVAVQQYQRAPWAELVVLWREYNRQLARVMAAVPLDVRHRVHTRPNPDAITREPVAATATTTLDFLMRDYVDHLRHHLRQIERLLD
jgi:uncharacterized damage-inducible protein DinB